MNYPDFFDKIETIKLKDDLANLLNAFEDGLVEFKYIDIVKSAGHSCPTVAGAYLMCLEGLKALYKNEIPKRGGIAVTFKEDASEGVAGVIANVVSQITGATSTSGFKGIGGNFVRHGLMKFNGTINSGIKLQRIDNGKSVEVVYNPADIQADPLLWGIMGKIKNGADVSADEKRVFGELWQERVKHIFENIDKVITVIHE